MAVLFLNPMAHADFGEIDLIVKESVENHFRELNHKVDLSSLTYEKEPTIVDSMMTVETAVIAIQGFTHEWGLHYCTTYIKIIGRGKYEDQGSDCNYDTDR